jgi:hypothetical protein
MAPVKVRNYLKSRDGTPWPRGVVLSYVADRIAEASKNGTGLRLTAEEVRSLDWSIIREEGGYDSERFREGSYAELGEATGP